MTHNYISDVTSVSVRRQTMQGSSIISYGFTIVDDFDFDINQIFILQINDIILYYIL